MNELVEPCGNCPFLKVGAIELRAGRLAGIIRDFRDDNSDFLCHKHAHGEEDDDTGQYHRTGDDKMCAGAMIYRFKLGRPSQMMRISERLGMLNAERLMKSANKVIEPAKRRRA
jgi:hypothetical protein